MSKVAMEYNARSIETLSVMRQMGLLLVTMDFQGKPNAMTIGWGSIGSIWERPMFTVLVRPSRYTHQLLDQIAEFTVNVPTPRLKDAVADCGARSGLEVDKFVVHRFTAVPGQKVQVPIIKECIGHYECRIVYRSPMDRSVLDRAYDEKWYPKDNYHTIYFGEILAAYWEG